MIARRVRYVISRTGESEGSLGDLATEDNSVGAVPDFTPRLRDAIERIREAGLSIEAEELDSSLQYSSTSSSEIIGEIGQAILGVQRRMGDALPIEVSEQLELCMAEIREVWQSIGDA